MDDSYATIILYILYNVYFMCGRSVACNISMRMRFAWITLSVEKCLFSYYYCSRSYLFDKSLRNRERGWRKSKGLEVGKPNRKQNFHINYKCQWNKNNGSDMFLWGAKIHKHTRSQAKKKINLYIYLYIYKKSFFHKLQSSIRQWQNYILYGELCVYTFA